MTYKFVLVFFVSKTFPKSILLIAIIHRLLFLFVALFVVLLEKISVYFSSFLRISRQLISNYTNDINICACIDISYLANILILGDSQKRITWMKLEDKIFHKCAKNQQNSASRPPFSLNIACHSRRSKRYSFIVFLNKTQIHASWKTRWGSDAIGK